MVLRLKLREDEDGEELWKPHGCTLDVFVLQRILPEADKSRMNSSAKQRSEEAAPGTRVRLSVLSDLESTADQCIKAGGRG